MTMTDAEISRLVRAARLAATHSRGSFTTTYRAYWLGKAATFLDVAKETRNKVAKSGAFYHAVTATLSKLSLEEIRR